MDTASLDCSVIIPTYNRSFALRKCLAALDCQEDPGCTWEIVVVDDGSTDNTPDVLRDMRLQTPLVWARQANSGPAVARNHGVRLSRGRVIVFLGDDIIPARHWLKAHMEAHKTHPHPTTAVLGFTTWSQDIRVTPFMQWLETSGVQFAYAMLAGKSVSSYACFYTCNVSVSRHLFLQVGGFDESFRFPAIEDTELGYRLERAGMTLYYCPDAIAYHYHVISFTDAMRKMEWAGIGAALFAKRHPEAPVPFLQEATAVRQQRWRNWRRWLLYPVAYVLGVQHIVENFWRQRLMNAYWRSYQSSRKEMAQQEGEQAS